MHANRLLEIRQTDLAVAVFVHSYHSVCKLFDQLKLVFQKPSLTLLYWCKKVRKTH